MKLTGLKGRIAVEPLDDERLTNIERRIVAGATDAVVTRRRAPRLGLAFGLGAAVVIAIGAGFAGWQLRGDGSTGTTTTTTAVAAAPMRVHTSGEQSVVDIGDARITVDPATDFTVTRPDGGVLVTMTRGKVELDVDKRAGRAPLVVAAGDTRVIVVGTRFSVDYGDGTGEVDVRVTEGVVEVERLQQAVRVAAEQAWTTKRGVIALAALPARPTLAATVDRDAEQIEIETAAPEVLDDRTARVPDAKIATTGVRRTAPPRPTRPDVIVRPRAPSQGAGTAALDVRALVRKQDILPPLDLGVRPEEAIGKYRQIVVEKTGDDASRAFYSIAAVQHLKLGRNGDALKTLDAYVRRFVGGKEYPAALWLRVRILCAQTIDDRCRQAAYTYLHQVPGTPAAKVAEALTLAPR